MKTKEELLKIAEGKAKKERFFGVEDVGIAWKGYHVFEMYFEPDKDGRPPCTGLPQFLLLDDEGNERIKVLTDDETFEILGLLPDEEPEEETE